MADSNFTIPQNIKNANTTFVAMFRSIDDSYMYGDYACQALFLYLLRNANRFERKFKGEILPPGSIRRASKVIMTDLGMSRSVFFRCLNSLRSRDTIETKTGRFGLHITICNYLKYQCINTEHRDEIETKSRRNRDGGRHENNKETIQELKKERISKSVPVAPTPGGEIWNFYESEFLKKFGKPPLRNAKVNSVCKKIAEAVGVEDGKKLIALFLSSDENFYKQRGYALEFALKDAQAILMDLPKSPQKTHQNQNMRFSGAPQMPTGPYIPPALTEEERKLKIEAEIDRSCVHCKGSGLLEEKDETGSQYRCTRCSSFGVRGLSYETHKIDQNSIERRRQAIERFRKGLRDKISV